MRQCPACPPWVVQCAHIETDEKPDHLLIVIGDNYLLGIDHAIERRYFVLGNPGRGQNGGFNTGELGQAQAEFHRREAALLGREA